MELHGLVANRPAADSRAQLRSSRLPLPPFWPPDPANGRDVAPSRRRPRGWLGEHFLPSCQQRTLMNYPCEARNSASKTLTERLPLPQVYQFSSEPSHTVTVHTCSASLKLELPVRPKNRNDGRTGCLSCGNSNRSPRHRYSATSSALGLRVAKKGHTRKGTTLSQPERADLVFYSESRAVAFSPLRNRWLVFVWLGLRLFALLSHVAGLSRRRSRVRAPSLPP